MKTIAVLHGDGIGREVVDSALAVLDVVARTHRLEFAFPRGLVGGAALEACGIPLPETTLDLCRKSDAVLLGAVGDPRFDGNPPERKPEKAILGLRKALGLFANIRPARIFTALIDASTLKRDAIEGVDLVVVRELTGGLYYGQPRGFEVRGGEETGVNTMAYSTTEIRRIAAVAFDLARKRRRSVCSVDKANVLETSQLWRRVVTEISRDYPDVELSHMYVDNCSMQLIRAPRQFDVILTENLFGDILSDEAAMLTGSIGMLPSASLGGSVALYEPVHGSAPDIAGQDRANPIAAVLSAAMMLRHSFDMPGPADQIEHAVESVLTRGLRTSDIASGNCRVVGTREMTAAICDLVGA